MFAMGWVRQTKILCYSYSCNSVFDSTLTKGVNQISSRSLLFTIWQEVNIVTRLLKVDLFTSCNNAASDFVITC